MAEESVKISALTEAHRNQLEGAFVPVAVPNQQTFKVPLSDFTDPLEIFVATYGTTLGETVETAIEAGKTIFAVRQVNTTTKLAALSDYTVGVFHFICQNADGTREIWELTSNGWTSDELPGGASELFTDDTLTGSGTQENPLGVDQSAIEEIALGEAEDAIDAIRSKIIYTLDLGSVTSGQTIQGNGNLFAKATLFNPNMNQPLNTAHSKIIFATNQTDQNVSIAYLALYRYDMTDRETGVANSINWVANTDNIASLLATTGLHIANITDVLTDEQNNPVQLDSSKMYYLVLFSNANGCKFIGNATSENLNTVPRVAFRTDNLNASDLSHSTIKTKFPTLTPESEINSRLFAAITNVATSDND